MPLEKETITDVIRFCNRDLVPDPDFRPADQFHNEWFIQYFSFIGNTAVENQLGDAFYQARVKKLGIRFLASRVFPAVA